MTAITPARSWSRLPDLVTTAGPRGSIEVTAPFDGSLLATVPDGTAEDVELAVDRARAAQPGWARLSLPARRAVLGRFAKAVLADEESVLDLVQAETGKARLSAFEELADVALTAGYYARTASRHLRPQRRRGAFPVLTRTVERYQPKGVVGVIAPWNYPLTLAVSDALAALVAGNTVVVKPDSQTPLTALHLLALLRGSGVPDDVVQVVTGAGRTLGTPLIDRVDYLMFTGSTATGRLVAEQCGRRLIGFSAELGGKNAMLVLDDADVDRAADGAVQACFSNAGQLCVSIERIYVHTAVHDEFLAAFTGRVRRMRVGPGRGWDVDMGSLISTEQLSTVRAHVEDAVATGATVVVGGRARPDLGPLFHEPTVLTGVTEAMTAAREETFGPVVAVYRVADEDEAVTRANDTAYGLNASVWSRRRGTAVARRLRAGTVNVNEGYAAAWGSHDAPMGGMGDSGMGRRHGREGIVKYTEPQTISRQLLIPVGPSRLLGGETYARVLSRAVSVLNRLP